MLHVSCSVVIYYARINLFLLVLFFADKRFAIHKKWRIPERLLLVVGALGGAPGGLLAMRLFHHKSRKPYFRIVYWLGLVAHLAVWFLLRQEGLFG